MRNLIFALSEGGTTIVLVAENDQKEVRRPGRIWHRVLVGLAACVALLIIFHRPILLAIGRQIALRYAAREHLKIDFRLEGNPFSHLTVRNLRAIPTGASGIESVDIDYLYVDYSLVGAFGSGCLKSCESAAAQTASETKAEITFAISRADSTGGCNDCCEK